MTDSDSSEILDSLSAALAGDAVPDTPPTDAMIDFGMDIMQNSAIGMKLVLFAKEHNVKIRIIKTSQETSYVPNNNEVVISLMSVNPAQPARFILLLTGAIREVMQIHEGMRPSEINENMNKILQKSKQKHGDKVGHMCAVAYEINEIETFKCYNMLRELRDMGYAEDLEIFIKHAHT